MCGITGYYRFSTLTSDLSWTQVAIKLFSKTEVRGRDACGVFFKLPEGSYHMRLLQPPSQAIESIDWTKLIDSKWGVMNARAVPEPEWIEHPQGPNVKDSQPAQVGKHVVVFNGILCNDKELQTKHNLQVPSQVDTFVIPSLLEKLDPVRVFKEELDGAFACLVGNTETDEFIATSNFVPLYYAVHVPSLTVFFASLGEWLGEVGLTPIEIGPYALMRILPSENQILRFININRTTQSNKVLAVCSSGLDSITTARLYQVLGREVKLLHFNYGCAASKKEIANIQRVSDLLEMDLQVVDARPIFKMFSNSRLLKGDAKLEDGVGWKKDAESITHSQKIVVRDGNKNVCHVPIGNFVDTLLNERARFGISTPTGEKLKVGDYQTLSYDRKRGIVWSPITYVHKHRPITSVWEIICSRGMKVQVTGNHSIFRFNKQTGSMDVVSSTQINVGDYLYVLRGSEDSFTCSKIDVARELEQYPTAGRRWLQYSNTEVRTTFTNDKKVSIPRFIDLGEDFAYVLGAYVAEGGDHCWAVKDEQFANEFLRSIQKVFKRKFILRKYKDKTYGNFNYEINLPSVVDRLLKTMCGWGCQNKAIPNSIFSVSHNIKWAFIKGLWKGDGSVNVNRNYNYADLSTTSEELAKKLTFLLRTLGCEVSCTKDAKTPNPNWSQVWTVSVSDITSYNLLAKKCNYPPSTNSEERKVPVAKEWINESNRTTWFGQNPTPSHVRMSTLIRTDKKLYQHYQSLPMGFVEVKSIQKIDYNGYVYDLSVEGTENFFAEDCLVHNSTVSYVPARNVIFSMIACGFAERDGYGIVTSGYNLVDSCYPDNTHNFLKRVDDLLPFALNWNANIRFRAPLVHLVKSEILNVALQINTPLQLSWSCYASKQERCGQCGPDSYRLFSFKKLGYKDMVPYLSYPIENFWDGCKDLPERKLQSLVAPLDFPIEIEQLNLWLQSKKLYDAVVSELW